jgi:HAD superfamily hydrolase (TIGR01450 family)
VSGGSVLVDGYDLVVFDLDGVIYLGDQPIPRAAYAVGQLRAAGKPVAYLTNNASRRAAEVAALLTSLGVAATGEEVVTSAVAAAHMLSARFAPASPVLVVGAPALAADVADAGLTVVAEAVARPAAVVQGYGPQVGWAQLAEACVAVRAGALWVATNADRTLPSPRGPLPGNGALVAALATALGRQPDVVVGKPQPSLFEQAVRQRGGRRPLVVGDRLDTDIEGARRSGMDSLLVLTGVSQPADLLAAPEHQRPTYVATDLNGLFTVDEAVRVPAPGAGGWSVRVDQPGRLVLAGSGHELDALRALCAVAWARPQAGIEVVPDGPAAAQVLTALGLTS